eukprot:3225516-Pyramimonas_sp.AAC.1
MWYQLCGEICGVRYVVCNMWCKLCGVSYVGQYTWCKLGGASYVVSAVLCKICCARYVVHAMWSKLCGAAADGNGAARPADGPSSSEAKAETYDVKRCLGHR